MSPGVLRIARMWKRGIGLCTGFVRRRRRGGGGWECDLEPGVDPHEILWRNY